MDKDCHNRATKIGWWKRKSLGLRASYFCDEHANEKMNYLKSNNIHYKFGDACPCCLAGFIEQYRHVDRGKCYRCKNGIFGSISIIEWYGSS